MIEALRARIEDKFAAAEPCNSPYPHMIIEDFFPADIYRKLVDWNPFPSNRGVEWMGKAIARTASGATPYHARKQINFHADQPFSAPAEQQDFWEEIKACFLGDDWFPKLVMAKFPLIFRYRFGDLMDEADFVSLFRRELFLQRQEPGFYLGPHTDIPTRVFTCIFSLAREEGWDHFGTELLSPRERLDRCWGNDHYDYEKFEVKKLAPYKPNNFLLFHKTRQSFHAVPAIDEQVPDQRYGMQFQFYEPAGGVFNDLSAPNIMRVIKPGQKGEKPPILVRAMNKIHEKIG